MEHDPETYRTARLTIHDVALVVVLAGPGFDIKTAAERQRVYLNVRESLRQSDPGADAALVWQDGESRTRFIVPPRQEPFFEIVRYDQLFAQADRTLTVTPG
jgi:hypothetical protein